MTIADVRSCFCGLLPLRKGCIGIGIFTIIYALVYVGHNIATLVEQYEILGYWPIEFTLVFSFGCLFTLLNLIAGSLVILGVRKENIKVLLAWLIYMALFLIFVQYRIYYFILVMFPVLQRELNENLRLIRMRIIWTFVDLIISVLYLYFMVIIYSFRRSLMKKEEPTIELEDTDTKETLL